MCNFLFLFYLIIYFLSRNLAQLDRGQTSVTILNNSTPVVFVRKVKRREHPGSVSSFSLKTLIELCLNLKDSSLCFTIKHNSHHSHSHATIKKGSGEFHFPFSFLVFLLSFNKLSNHNRENVDIKRPFEINLSLISNRSSFGLMCLFFLPKNLLV